MAKVSAEVPRDCLVCKASKLADSSSRLAFTRRPAPASRVSIISLVKSSRVVSRPRSALKPEDVVRKVERAVLASVIEVSIFAAVVHDTVAAVNFNPVTLNVDDVTTCVVEF